MQTMDLCIKMYTFFLFYVILSIFGAVNGDIKQGDGVVLTTRGGPKGTQIAHIPAMPYYQPLPPHASTLAIPNRNIWFLSVDVDYRNNMLFLYDYYFRTIVACHNYTPSLDSKDMSLQVMHIGVSKDTIHIAYDWMSKTLYWVDSGFRWIVATPTGDKDKIKSGYSKIIADTNLEEPEALALDPIKGYLFWADNGKHAKIERSAMDGSKRTTLIRAALNYPRAMEVDIAAKRIYWTDSTSDTIESADYDGKDRTIVRRLTGTTLLDIAIFRDVAMVTDMKTGNVFVLNKTDGQTLRKSFKIGLAKTYGIAVFNQENQPMPTDYCTALNCSHLCISEENGAKCVCAEGYVLNATTKACTEAYGRYHRAIVMATKDQICLIDIRSWSQMNYTPTCVFSTSQVPTVATTGTTSPTSALSSTTDHPFMTMIDGRRTTPSSATPTTADKIVLMDVDMEDRVVYFSTTSNIIYSRALDLPFSNPTKQKITEVNGNISGLVYDWNDRGNLYYSESDTGNIHVVNVLNGMTKQISNTSYTNPQHLVLLPLKRQLAWIVQANDTRYYIERMDITGTGYMRYKKGYTDPRGLIVDHEAQAFYVLDGKIWKQPYDENNGRTDYYVSTGSQTAHIFLKYKDYFGFLYPSSGGMSRMKTFLLSAQIMREIVHGQYSSSVQSIKVLDVSVLKRIPDPCAANNGGCEQLCQLHYENGNYVKKCSCTIGYQQGEDPNKCTPNPVFDDDFALVTDSTNNMIYQINLKQPDQLSAFKTPTSRTFIGVLYDRVNKRVLWTELYKRTIYSAALDGKNFTHLADLGFKYGNRIALDETSGNIFYTTRKSFFNSIGVISPLSLKPATLLMINTGYNVNDIVIHPGNGKMYYAVHHAKSAINSSYIGRADMDGKNYEKLIIGPQVRYPIGLAIDYKNNHLYWTDFYFDTITQCDLDGNNCTVVVKQTGADMHDVGTDGVYIYFTAWNRNHIEKRPISNFDSVIKMGVNPELGKLEALALYSSTSSNKQPVNEFCKARNGRGNCSTFCLPKKGGYVCACPGDQILLPDKITCSGVTLCDKVIKQNATDLSGKYLDFNVFIDDSCLRYPGDKCAYSCPIGFKRSQKAPALLNCQSNGWDLQATNLCQIPQCQRKISHGTIDPKCPSKPGDTCTFTCTTGYKKVASHVICRSDDTWYPENACEELLCPVEFDNGKVPTDCDRKPNSMCNYACNLGLDANKNVAKVQCLPTGQWNLAQQLCVGQVKVSLAQTGDKEATSSNATIGLSVGFAVLCVALVVVIIVAFRRRRRDPHETPYLSNFDNPSSDTAMENPIYLVEEEPDNTEGRTHRGNVARNNSGPL